MLRRLRQHAEDAAATLPALMADAQQAVISIMHGQHAQRKSGSGEKFWQFREYQPGDRPQDIDWRQSAKTDHVYIRQKELQTTQTNVLWCSRHQSMDFTSRKKWHTKADTARIITLALGLLLTRGGELISLFGAARAGRSGKMVDFIGHELCTPADDHAALPQVQTNKLPRNAYLIQTGDYLEPLAQIEESFKLLASRSSGGFIIQVLDPAELDLPYDGRTIFEEPGDNVRQNIDHVSSIRAAYQKRIEQQIKGVEALARQYGWHYILHLTDREVEKTLALIWARMTHHAEYGG